MYRWIFTSLKSLHAYTLLHGYDTRRMLMTGGTPLYKRYGYVPPHWVGFLRRFGLKTGVHFAQSGLESGMDFGGTTECMNLFIVVQ